MSNYRNETTISKTVTFGIYRITGWYGAWAKSRENNRIIGDVRVIGGMLMKVCSIETRMFSKDEVTWVPAMAGENTKYNLENWVEGLGRI